MRFFRFYGSVQEEYSQKEPFCFLETLYILCIGMIEQ